MSSSQVQSPSSLNKKSKKCTRVLSCPNRDGPSSCRKDLSTAVGLYRSLVAHAPRYNIVPLTIHKDLVRKRPVFEAPPPLSAKCIFFWCTNNMLSFQRTRISSHVGQQDGNSACRRLFEELLQKFWNIHGRHCMERVVGLVPGPQVCGSGF